MNGSVTIMLPLAVIARYRHLADRCTVSLEDYLAHMLFEEAKWSLIRDPKDDDDA